MTGRRTLVLAAVLSCVALLLPRALAQTASPAAGTGQAMAGVCTADATWNVGSAAGQYASDR
ncbi:MAG: hypothetical protein JWP02_3647, partial [Acidimicrobiales bacterium]|nr:hypothetical protein [Acidimicrobiales bacterium]